MREMTGRDEDGKKLSKEVYRNMVTGEVFEPHNAEGNPVGWNGNPPVPRSGGAKDGITVYSPAYVANFDQIKWDTPRGKSSSQ